MTRESHTLAVENKSDEQLITLASGGDRQAYGLIVNRYQNLICSLAYCECGDFSQSEDMAQETFVAAWKSLPQLRDPLQFRAWLCGIARNLVANHLRKRKRKGADVTLPLDGVAEPSTADESPADSMISQEEQSLIWSSLENIPETYRTPLVLFYRQDQSVDEVASSLEITPEAARQRLSRGRTLLRDKVAGLVERSLSASRPGKSFTLATLAAIPTLSVQAKAASVAATAAKGAALIKGTATLTVWGALLGPLLGIFGGALGTWAAIQSASSQQERKFLIKLSRLTLGLTLIFSIGLTFLILYATEVRALSEALFTASLISLVVSHIAAISGLTLWGNRHLRTLRDKNQPEGTVHQQATPSMSDRPRREYKTKATLLGLPLIHVAFGGTEKGRYERAKAVGWIAIGDMAYGVILSCGGIAIGGIAFGGMACGLFALGGVAAGGIAIGGLALGGMAAGGMAVAWQAAFGGLAVAVEYSLGGMAVAREANSEAAEAFFANNPLMTGARAIMDHSRWFLLLALWPVIAARRAQTRSRSQ